MINSISDVTILGNKKILGEGAFSEVVRVRNKKDNKTYALKKIDTREQDSEEMKNLRREVVLHKTIEHPHIIRFQQELREGNWIYILLEEANNGNLYFYIHSREGLPEPLALRFFYQTAQAVKYLHDRNIIHRDIKPENILFDQNFNIKLCDLGWSCRHESDDSMRETICGTYEYMSPEIVLKRQHDSKVDIWCLGILLYEMLHGAPPINASDWNAVKGEMKNLCIMIDEGLQPDTKALLQCLLETDLNQRYSIDQVLSHPALTHMKADFERPMSPLHMGTLMNNYLLNIGENDDKRVLPHCLQSVLDAKPVLKQKGGLRVLREFVQKNFKRDRKAVGGRKVYLNQPIPDKTNFV